MSLFKDWFTDRFGSARIKPRHGANRRRVKLQLETLEDRVVPSTITVTNLADSGAGSLRAAIAQANAASGQDTINFAVSGTITLQSELPSLSNSVDILGPGPTSLTVQRDAAAPAFGIFNIDPGLTVTISGLTLSGGVGVGGLEIVSRAGGITANNDILTVSNCVIANNNGFT